MKLLVTGGLGFIGSNFIEFMLKNYDSIDILNVDKCNYVAREYNVSPNPRYRYVQGDITEVHHMTAILREYKPDILVNFAAQTSVDESFIRSFDFTRDNVLGTHTLLEALRAYGKIQKFIHISTDEVYGEVAPQDISSESAHLNPSNPYSASKAAAELYVQAYGHSYDLPWIITRGNNVFGPKQYPEKVVPLFLTRLLNGEKCQIHGDGSAKRSFIYVDDVSRAIDRIIFKGEIKKIYNIGSSHEYSVLDIFYKIAGLSAPHLEPDDLKMGVKDRQFNDCRYCIDSSEIQKLGWSEDPDFDACLQKTFEWYSLHRDWYRT
jgi:nucleoside-diphosphate-sugar epimerase